MLKSTNVAGARPAVYPDEAGKVLVSDGTYEITAALNVDEQTIALCSLPAGCIPLDFTLIVDDLDSGTPAIVVDGGGINAAEDAVDRIMISASTVAQAGGVARSTLFPMVAPVETETLFGMHITTAAGTAVAGTIRGILTYRAEEYGG
ncbi:MAG TPA: hypothetical protein DDZ40_07330 [Deltaproteobacteria bacterium]|nr:hypothetical protein [Deltaproteobacteria bacterium]